MIHLEVTVSVILVIKTERLVARNLKRTGQLIGF